MIFFKLFYGDRRAIKNVVERYRSLWFIIFVTAFAFAEKMVHFFLREDIRWTIRISGIIVPPEIQLIQPLITIPINIVLTSLFVYFIILMIKKQSRFIQSLRLGSYTSMIFCIAYTIKMIAYCINPSTNFNTHLGILFLPLVSEGIFYRFLSQFDVFSIWQIALLAIGLDELGIIKTKKGFFILLVAYISLSLFKVLISKQL